MTWWAWMIGGAILLGSELAFVDARFYLVFLGTAAIVTGVAAGSYPDLAVWAQWLVFAALSVISMVGFRERIYDRLRGRAPQDPAGPAGDALQLPKSLEPGESCQVEHGGTYWTVRNAGATSLAAGARVRIAQVQGLTLLVQPDAG